MGQMLSFFGHSWYSIHVTGLKRATALFKRLPYHTVFLRKPSWGMHPYGHPCISGNHPPLQRSKDGHLFSR